ncbi:MAG: hypothetical protein ACI4V1_03875 [Eubacteriales bacterium]
MGKSLAKQAAAVTDGFKNFKNANPLMVRKKFQMKDVCFRRDFPEEEVFRCELAFDVELYVLLFAAALLLLCCLCHGHRRRRGKR